MAPKFRVLVLALTTAIAVSLFVPGEAAAQHRGGGSGGHQGAVAAWARPGAGGAGGYYPARPYYYPAHYYYSPYFYSPYTTTTRSSGAAWGGYGYGSHFGLASGMATAAATGRTRIWYHYGGYYDLTGAARLQVSPKEAQVFVDGYYVGVADEFDGTLQRLRVDAGQHEVELYLEGYRTVRTPILFRREGTVTIRTAMEPLAAGETSERPTPLGPRAGERDDPNDPEPQAAMRAYPGERMPPQPPPRAPAV